MHNLSRRDFLKLLGVTAAGAGLAGFKTLSDPHPSSGISKPNIILLVLDAMSARNLSVYGYPRPTTPNLERFAQRATVYHSHISAGNFTTPGTASLLTGLLPWNHRALSRRSLVRRDLGSSSIFHALGDGYTRLGYSQNLWADLFLRQFKSGIDQHIAPSAYSFKPQTMLASHHLPNDSAMAYYVFDEFLLSTHQVLNPYPGSAMLGYLDYSFGKKQREDKVGFEDYPYGMPSNSYYYYRNQDVLNGLAQMISDTSAQSDPWFGYFHLYSPHGPYRPRKQFIGSMPAIELEYKKRHILAAGHLTKEIILFARDQYDEFIADLDFELGKFLDNLEQTGILDNSYLIITSDHGEVFERGETGHGSPLLYDPVIRIPLLVSSPGQTERRDVYVPTSSADLLPTIAQLSGSVVPKETDGRLLPGLGGGEDAERSIFSVVAKENSSFLPIQSGTVSMIKGKWKLIYYYGYEKFPDQFELFDLERDLEEKRNLLALNPSAAPKLKEELLDALQTANARY